MKKSIQSLSLVEKKTYVIDNNLDLVIFLKCKQLENYKLSKKDREIIKLIKDQLKKKWRQPLLRYLNKLTRNHK